MHWPRDVGSFAVVVAGCGGGDSTTRFASGRDIANAIQCTDYREEQTGPVQNSGGKLSGQAEAMAALVRTVGYCQLFNKEIQTNEVVNIVMFKAPGNAAKLDETLRSLCPVFSGESGSGDATTLRSDDWEVILDRDRPALGTLDKIKASIGGTKSKRPAEGRFHSFRRLSAAGRQRRCKQQRHQHQGPPDKTRECEGPSPPRKDSHER